MPPSDWSGPIQNIRSLASSWTKKKPPFCLIRKPAVQLAVRKDPASIKIIPLSPPRACSDPAHGGGYFPRRRLTLATLLAASSTWPVSVSPAIDATPCLGGSRNWFFTRSFIKPFRGHMRLLFLFHFCISPASQRFFGGRSHGTCIA